MDSHLTSILALLCLLLARANASLPAEDYWNLMLPNTPLPEVLRILLQPDMGNTTSLLDAGTDDWNILYNIFNYNRGSISRTYAIPNSTVFFMYNDLHPYTKMEPFFTKPTNKAGFLPRQVAESIPFSSHNLVDILKLLSKNPSSVEAQIIKDTLEECEEPNLEGEDKYCATSLESLVDFVFEKFGRNVQILATAVEEESKRQEYSISKGVKMVGDKAVVCHKTRYAYSVFYCHSIGGTKVYVVPFVGVDGTKMEGVAICHMNTSAWSPDHIAFQVLKTKPGPPICHFPGADTLVWISN